jgi:hypothetical protein
VPLKTTGLMRKASRAPAAANGRRGAGSILIATCAPFARWKRVLLRKWEHDSSVIEESVNEGARSRQKIRNLRQREFVRITKNRGYCAVQCLAGALWITQEGDRKDHLIVAGDEFEITRRGLAVIEALQDGTVCSIEKG